jgi:hypothetical protein
VRLISRAGQGPPSTGGQPLRTIATARQRWLANLEFFGLLMILGVEFGVFEGYGKSRGIFLRLFELIYFLKITIELGSR